MILEIWILEKDIERLKELCSEWLSLKDKTDQSIEYCTFPFESDSRWICVHISLDNYTILKDHNLIKKIYK